MAQYIDKSAVVAEIVYGGNNKAMKRKKTLDELLSRVSKETEERIKKQMSCKWLRYGDECGKGLPGTTCQVIGCMAWEHYEKEENDEKV